MSTNFNKQKFINHWIDSSDSNYRTMGNLLDKKEYSWALFMGHLVIEKLLKAYYVKVHNNFPPLIHNLVRLAELSNLELTKEQQIDLVSLTTFNINARYDDYKDSFEKKCSLDYTIKWIDKIKEMRKWIKTLLEK
jgi:HEPN domain-containing protein